MSVGVGGILAFYFSELFFNGVGSMITASLTKVLFCLIKGFFDRRALSRSTKNG